MNHKATAKLKKKSKRQIVRLKRKTLSHYMLPIGNPIYKDRNRFKIKQ